VTAALLVAGYSRAEPSGTASQPESFCSGYSTHLFADANPADAVASLSVWADFLVEKWDIHLDSKPIVFSNSESMKASLLAHEVEMVTMLTEEFFALESEVKLSTLSFASFQGEISDEYLLLVRSDSGVENLAALQGKSIALMDGRMNNLSIIWMETLLMKQGFSELPGFFKSCTPHPKNSRVVLSVFFGTADACLIKRRGYETMVEMNPQVGKATRVIATSPSLVPALICFRDSYQGAHKPELLAALRDLHKKPRGQQILTAFKSDRIVPGTIEDLATTRELIQTHALLKAARNKGTQE
jgi:ABC-type phosphate/phosphonate transport system substrate-binding protein